MHCESDPTNTTEDAVVDVPKRKEYKIPRFNRDSAYAYVQKQVNFGPRVPNMASHTACKEWLVGKFKEFGASVIEQDFQATAYTGTVLNSTNIIASYNLDADERILLAAHWDTRHIADKDNERTEEPIDGADDGGSGVAALLEIARQINLTGIDLGVDIVLFDAEDHGEENGDTPDTWCLGSQYWSKTPHKAGYRAKFGVLLDMIGSKNARFPKEGVSMKYAPQLVNKIWKLGQNMGYGNHFVNTPVGGITDDHYYVNEIARIPMIDIINLPGGTKTFGHYHHTHDDNIDVIDKRVLGATGQVVLAAIYRENNGTL